MKQLLTTIAALVLVGCGESQQSVPQAETKPVDPVAEAAKPEPPPVKAPDISIHDAAAGGDIEAVKQHLAAGTDVNAKDQAGITALDKAIMITRLYDRNHEIVDLLRKHGGKTKHWLSSEESISIAAYAGHIEAVK